jgi:dihydroxyacetone kinase
VTRLWNEPEAFVDEMIAGFVAANSRYVRRVPGGVVRAVDAHAGEVAVVIGGGSGHYPAFGGLVGPGLAHAAAMGNVFASPSTHQIISVAQAAERGGGVLFSYGNYAGDVLNFNAAQGRLRASGIPCETVVVTDDIVSAGTDERSLRRGVAGDLAVFRIAAAAAEAGYDLKAVAEVAGRANDRTRSLGVAFTGCTLPGAERPLFSVPDDRMALGLGIHGEPGIDETELPTADGLAELLVTGLLAEAPNDIGDAGMRVVPILNGLGSLKYEEMFVVYRRIAELLDSAGAEVVDPHVGEYCTSFDMAGGSLTLLWLDDELEKLWATRVDTPGYRHDTAVPRAGTGAVRSTSPGADTAQAVKPADHESRTSASVVVAAIAAALGTVEENLDELGRLDAVAGDGDHGIGMKRGASSALAAAKKASAEGAGAGTTLASAAAAWANSAGGTSGALWGVILSSVADALGDEGTPGASDVALGWAAAATAVMEYGKAHPGDKTLVDSLVPFAAALDAAVRDGIPLVDAWRAAAATAASAAAATAELRPRIGRARPLAEKSLGIPDPGAHSLALIVCAVGEALAQAKSKREGQT